MNNLTIHKLLNLASDDNVTHEVERCELNDHTAILAGFVPIVM